MPEITLSLSDAEFARLEETAKARHQTPESAILYCMNKELWKPPRDRASAEYRRRGTDRLTRQIRLVAWIKQHGPPDSKVTAQELADQMGVSLRTIYRDIDLALDAIGRESQVGPAVLSAPHPPPRVGRPPRIPRYREAVGH